jgi:hypothetical protein
MILRKIGTFGTVNDIPYPCRLQGYAVIEDYNKDGELYYRQCYIVRVGGPHPAYEVPELNCAVRDIVVDPAAFKAE